MHRNRSALKRTASPVSVPDSSTDSKRSFSSQVDGACFGKPDAPDPEPTPEIPPMPAFLQLTNEETHDKYAELTRLENERLGEGSRNPSVDSQWARLDPDPVLDRYNNIHPWANNRIHLKVPEGFNDYINASPVSLVSTSEVQSKVKAGVQDKYICMQGPKIETVDHVWHMVWHELSTPYNSTPAVIIMLSPTHVPDPDTPGKQMEKCYPYFPLGQGSPVIVINETNNLGDNFRGTIRLDFREPSTPGTTVEVRKLTMTVDGEDEEKPIWHFLYPSWPDFGALEEQNVQSIISLMSLSREKNGKAENPRLVHCSAGVGRTGTFVALEFLVGELQGGAWEGWDKSGPSSRDPVFDTVNQLRMQRRTMVQAYEQYAFLYEVLRKMWEEKYGTPCVGGDHQHGDSRARQQTNVCAMPGEGPVKGQTGGCG